MGFKSICHVRQYQTVLYIIRATALLCMGICMQGQIARIVAIQGCGYKAEGKVIQFFSSGLIN
jgi:hypothetical protein